MLERDRDLHIHKANCNSNLINLEGSIISLVALANENLFNKEIM